MYNPTDPSYKQAREIKTGKHKLHPVHQQLIDWVSKQFHVHALDFQTHTIETPAGYQQQMLFIILETIAECERMEKTNYQELTKKFIDYFTSSDQALKKMDPLKSKVGLFETRPFPEIIIGFHALESIELKVAKPKVKLDDLFTLKKYKDQISGTSTFNGGMSWIVFYYTDAQVKENRTNGISAEIEAELLQQLKKHDAFNYFGPHSVFVQFDSKETYDRDFNGQDYMYYR